MPRNIHSSAGHAGGPTGSVNGWRLGSSQKRGTRKETQTDAPVPDRVVKRQQRVSALSQFVATRTKGLGPCKRRDWAGGREGHLQSPSGEEPGGKAKVGSCMQAKRKEDSEERQ